MGSSNQEFTKEFSKAITYGMLERLERRAENNTQKRRVRQTIENLQNKINEMLLKK